VYNGVQPVNWTDTVALTHDINYIANGDPDLIARADELAVTAAHGPGSLVMKLGLTVRRLLHLYEGESNFTNSENGRVIRDYVLLSQPQLRSMFLS
jgi:hypothetical protein